MKKTLQAGNILAFTAVILINYLSNTGFFNDKTIAEVSKQYNTLITPAPYTFAIWGLIYLLLLGFVLFQARSLLYKNAQDSFVQKTGWWFIISCAANSMWVISWLFDYTLLSIFFMLLLLISILRIIVNNRMELYDAPLTTIAFLWWPFVIYCGWITVATIVNISAFLVKMKWNGWGFDPVFWTITLVIIATIINIRVVSRRNMREFAAVGIWSFIGIAVANQEFNSTIFYACLSAAVILLIVIFSHAYKNRETNPVRKLFKGELYNTAD